MEQSDTTVCCSFNEIESLSKLAARGCQYPWCVAKETGRAVRWLAEHDLPGALMLLQLLEQVDNKPLSCRKPIASPDGKYTRWHANGQALCPVLAGLSLVDFSGVWCSEPQVLLDSVFSPGLILPFAAQASSLRNIELSISWKSCQVVCKNGQLLIREDDQAEFFPAMESSHASTVSIQCSDVFSPRTETAPSPRKPLLPFQHVERARIDAVQLQALGTYAARTYAPATESSRLSGAGAGVSDND